MNYYEILGVSIGATEKEIHKAYIKLAREYHPDMNPNNQELLEKMKEINTAYEVLGDVEKRKEYNRRMGLDVEEFYSQQEDEDIKREAEDIWKRATQYYEESMVNKKEEVPLDEKHKFPVYFSLPFIWLIAFLYMPYTTVASLLLNLARFTELGKSNLNQRRTTGISILLLTSILALLMIKKRMS